MNFEEINLPQQVLKNLKHLGFTELTQIQELSIPEIREGKDIAGQSLTGSGKTAAFGLPIIEKIQPGRGIQALVLTPTRELCVQVADSLHEFAMHTGIRIAKVYGGVGIEPQIKSLKQADIVVGTPGRILDHMERRTIYFDAVKFLVLDEADRMLEMGFIDDVERIISQCPKERQTLLYSATIPTAIHQIIRRYQKDPLFIKTEIRVDKSLLKQVFYDLSPGEKFSALVHLLKKAHGLSIIFCATRREVDIVSKNLLYNNVKAMPIHGGMTQNKRLKTVEMLKKEGVKVMVATDVAARGLDIKNVTHVFNYDVPKTSEDYVHRIGRTARIGMSGEAITLLTPRDHDNFRNVMSDPTLKIEKGTLPQLERVKFQRQQGQGDHGPREGYRGQRSPHRQSGFRGQGSHSGPRRSNAGRRPSFLGR